MDYKSLINTLHYEISSADYHGLKNSYSSSQLKDMLKDPEVFYRKYISKEEARLELAAFDIGTYFHTAILEPHLLETECAVYSEGIRSGKKWEQFKEDNKGKAIITIKEKENAEKIIKAVKDSPIAMNLLDKTKKEVSAFVEIMVMGKEIYCLKNDEMYQLSFAGWVPAALDDEEQDAILDFSTKLILKTRADAICVEEGFICDLKSTTGNTKDNYEMQAKVASYEYDFSAALYLDIFSMASGMTVDKFYWIFSSKDFGNSKTYLASDKNMFVGRAKWKKSAIELAKYISSDWQFTDSLGVIEPTFYNLDWLKEE